MQVQKQWRNHHKGWDSFKFTSKIITISDKRNEEKITSNYSNRFSGQALPEAADVWAWLPALLVTVSFFLFPGVVRKPGVKLREAKMLRNLIIQMRAVVMDNRVDSGHIWARTWRPAGYRGDRSSAMTTWWTERCITNVATYQVERRELGDGGGGGGLEDYQGG